MHSHRNLLSDLQLTQLTQLTQLSQGTQAGIGIGSCRSSSRIDGLDGLRGFLILFMTCNHLLLWPLRQLETVYNWSYQPIGFVTAAEGFFIISGFLAGISYAGIFVKIGMLGVWQRALVRMTKLYAVNLTLTVMVGFLIVQGLLVSPVQERLSAEVSKRPWHSFIDALFNLDMPWLCDVLPVYIVLLPLGAMILWMMNSGRVWQLFVCMLSAWSIGHYYPQTHLVHWLERVFYPNTFGFGWFEIASWQLVFGSAFVAGVMQRRRILPQWLQRPPKRLFWASVAILCICGVQRHLNWPLSNQFAQRFSMVQSMGILRLINVIALVIFIRGSWPVFTRVFEWRPLVLVGRTSLVAYSAQVVVVYISAYGLQKIGPLPDAVAAVMLVGGVMAIYLVAWLRTFINWSPRILSPVMRRSPASDSSRESLVEI